MKTKPILLTIAALLTALGLYTLDRSFSLASSSDTHFELAEKKALEAQAMIPAGEVNVRDEDRDAFHMLLMQTESMTRSAVGYKKTANEARLMTAGFLLAAAAAAAIALRKKKDASAHGAPA